MKNELLRQARERLPSPSRRGENLSRAELAAQVNLLLFDDPVMARRSPFTANYVGKLENGIIRYPGPDYRRVLRTVLQVRTDEGLGFHNPRSCDPPDGIQIKPATKSMAEPLSASAGRTIGFAVPPATASSAVAADQDVEEQDVRRRRLFEFAALSLAAGPMVRLEALRHDLIHDTGRGTAANIDEWEAVAWDYGYSYTVTPPATLLDDLAVDLHIARDHYRRLADEKSRRAMQRVIALLQAFLAQTWGNLGNTSAARRWWRAAQIAADQSADCEVRTWIQGRQIICGLNKRWPLTEVLALAENAAAAKTRPGMGTGSVFMGRAQVLAVLGRTQQARAAMAAVYDLVDRLPPRVTGDVTTMFGWPEYRLRHGESFVYAHLNDTDRVVAAHDHAMKLYPAHMFRERAQVQLHHAMCMVRNGDTTAGAEQAYRTISDLPKPQRIEAVTELARTVLRTVPATERQHPAVALLSEAVAVPTPPSHQW